MFLEFRETLPNWLTLIVFTRPVSKVRGRIDIVFANAGFGEICSLWGRHRRAFSTTIQPSIEGNAVTCKGLTATDDGGSIILNGSVAEC